MFPDGCLGPMVQVDVWDRAVEVVGTADVCYSFILGKGTVLSMGGRGSSP